MRFPLIVVVAVVALIGACRGEVGQEAGPTRAVGPEPADLVDLCPMEGTLPDGTFRIPDSALSSVPTGNQPACVTALWGKERQLCAGYYWFNKATTFSVAGGSWQTRINSYREAATVLLTLLFDAEDYRSPTDWPSARPRRPGRGARLSDAHKRRLGWRLG